MSRQFMLRNLDAHILVIVLLKDSLKRFKQIQHYNEDCYVTKIFIECFNFLITFCKNDNKLNKKLLYNHINFFMELINYVELGQANLIN